MHTRLAAAASLALSLAACHKEPKGTPIALPEASGTLGEQAYAWRVFSTNLAKQTPPRLAEALYASNQALQTMRRCLEKPEDPECKGTFMAGGDLIQQRSMMETLLAHANLLTQLGHGRAALDVIGESERYGAGSYSFADRARGETYFSLKKYDDAIVSFKRSQANPGPNHLMDAHIAHALARSGKKAEAAAAVDALERFLADSQRKAPATFGALSGPDGELGKVRAELDAMRAE